MNCSVAQCLEVVGEWWSMLIVRDAFMGVTRFDDFHERLGISRNVLNQRLSHLVDHGVLERVAYSEHPPALRLPVDRQGQGPVAGAHRHAPMGRPLGGPGRAAHRDGPQGLRPRHPGRRDLLGVRRSRVRARRSGRCRPRGDRGSPLPIQG